MNALMWPSEGMPVLSSQLDGANPATSPDRAQKLASAPVMSSRATGLNAGSDSFSLLRKDAILMPDPTQAQDPAHPPQARQDHHRRPARRIPQHRAAASIHRGGAWQLLVATILSAQCTDARVNKVTPGLFEQFPTLADFAEAPIEEIEEAIRSTGFFRNKAKSLQGAARAIIEKHGGKVPDDMTELVKLPGRGPQDRQRRPGRDLEHARRRGRGHPRGPHQPQAGPDRPDRPGEGREAAGRSACPRTTGATSATC